MTIKYVSVDEAIRRGGVRMMVVGGVPSPWGEAAKGILHMKRIDWVAVRLLYDSEPLKEWAGQRSGPVLVYENERPRSGWAEILLLAERLAPAASLLPANASERALVFGLAHEICGEAGLGWTRRLQLVHAGLSNAGGFSEPATSARNTATAPRRAPPPVRESRNCSQCWRRASRRNAGSAAAITWATHRPRR
ncbi:MAG TPA: hypothetical protein VF113_15100, partial [Stellaceae bacterium]